MWFLDHTQLKRKQLYLSTSSFSSDITERQTLNYDDYFLQSENSFESKKIIFQLIFKSLMK